MNGQKQGVLNEIAEAGIILLLCGFGGSAVGALTSLATSVLFLGAGALYVALLGAFSGFCAATCGAALGGRRGWAISGALWGFYGGYRFVLFLNSAPAGQAGIGSGLAALLIMAAPAVGGYLLGESAGGIAEPLPSGLASTDEGWKIDLTRLDTLAPPLRLGLALGQLLPVLVCMLGALGRVPLAWIGIH